MKVIWVVNIVMQDVAAEWDEKEAVSVTWIENMLYNIKDSVTLVVCSPISNDCQIKKTKIGQVLYYGIPRKHWRGDKYEKELKFLYQNIFQIEQPNLIHIWGTEFPHTLSAVEAAERCNLLDKTVISIQGLVSIYAKHFMSNVPFWVRYLMVPKNFIRGWNLYLTQCSYKKRGQYEIKALQKVQHVIGRTEWDKACVAQVNSNILYHKNNENMREVFYHKKWSYKTCIPYRIFLSQGGGPIKGMHILLEAMAILKREYPTVCLYVTGRNILGNLTFKQFLGLNPYDWYIRQEVKKKQLEDHVFFVGGLNAEQMCDQYLKANVSVLPSCIENSPNSLGEAMLIGTPCVAANVGGISSLVESSEMFLYPWDEPYMLAYYLDRVFQEKGESCHRAELARRHAKQTHDVKKNVSDLLAIYCEIGDLKITD